VTNGSATCTTRTLSVERYRWRPEAPMVQGQHYYLPSGGPIQTFDAQVVGVHAVFMPSIRPTQVEPNSGLGPLTPMVLWLASWCSCLRSKKGRISGDRDHVTSRLDCAAVFKGATLSHTPSPNFSGCTRRVRTDSAQRPHRNAQVVLTARGSLT